MSGVCMETCPLAMTFVCHKSGMSHARIACIQSCRLIDCVLRTPFLISVVHFGNCDCERITMLDIGLLHSFSFPGIFLSAFTAEISTLLMLILFQFLYQKQKVCVAIASFSIQREIRRCEANRFNFDSMIL